MYKLKIWKVRSTWSYFLTNPVGGGFGSNAVTSKRGIIGRALRGLAVGTRYTLECNGKQEGEFEVKEIAYAK